MGLEEIRRLKNEVGIPKPKKAYVIPKKSAKKIKQEILAKGDDEALDLWFVERRKDLVGTCQCGCGNKSQKKDDTFYRHCICHIYPKRLFKSVCTHPLNFVERSFWGGCHSVLDDTSMDRWPSMADWDDIKAKAIAMQPYLTEQEKATKFYNHLEKLINEN